MKRRINIFVAFSLLLVGVAHYFRGSEEPAARSSAAHLPLPMPATKSTIPEPTHDTPPVATVQREWKVDKRWMVFYTDENMQAATVTPEQANAIEALRQATNAELMAIFASCAVLQIDAPNSCTVSVELPDATVQRLRETYLRKLGEIVGADWMVAPAAVRVVGRMERLLHDFGASPLVFAFIASGIDIAGVLQELGFLLHRR